MALLIGVAYFLIGRFPVPDSNVHAWRLAAWAASGVVYAAHIGYEYFRLRNAPRVLAWHAAVGVAIGAVGLAVAGMIHTLWATSAIQSSWLLALVIWPAATAIPAFLGALVVGALLARFSRRART